MKKLIPLAAVVFSAHSFAATDHNAHDGHGATHAPSTAETPSIKVSGQTIDKSAGKVKAPSKSKNHASHSRPSSSDGHAHKHPDAK
ncbi:hypothetical protein [Methylosarcina fibrata]|jgi:hypothetical protein|uniref:hypothetical protein n=1 Tax=Methylosarcina fibrata TaxID=105972 RepID=UPI0012FB8F41|nr:hypothetical protein [Methylosarcina fibrata]